MSFVMILEKIDRVITAPHCTYLYFLLYFSMTKINMTREVSVYPRDASLTLYGPFFCRKSLCMKGCTRPVRWKNTAGSSTDRALRRPGKELKSNILAFVLTYSSFVFSNHVFLPLTHWFQGDIVVTSKV